MRRDPGVSGRQGMDRSAMEAGRGCVCQAAGRDRQACAREQVVEHRRCTIGQGEEGRGATEAIARIEAKDELKIFRDRRHYAPRPLPLHPSRRDQPEDSWGSAHDQDIPSRCSRSSHNPPRCHAPERTSLGRGRSVGAAMDSAEREHHLQRGLGVDSWSSCPGPRCVMEDSGHLPRDGLVLDIEARDHEDEAAKGRNPGSRSRWRWATDCVGHVVDILVQTSRVKTEG
mmetsp:Transcript_20201/g.45939  ORF Transcript_20201/g.45939 Transcript_20201/m.45939 type:complete len:228 (+) Transcript_20201:788-1471(+)